MSPEKEVKGHFLLKIGKMADFEHEIVLDSKIRQKF